MPLPDLIEIIPLTEAVHAEITVPGSKSITNRALILAALASGETVLRGALWSEDTQVMAECLQRLGFHVLIEPDALETCNRTITVRGLGGKIPNSGSTDEPLDLFVGNAGTAARFLTALACLGQGVYRMHGVPRMHERPQAPLFEALRGLGYRIDSPNNHLPAFIHGDGPRAGACRVSVKESSQFASALLLANSAHGLWQIDWGDEAGESELPYVNMTEDLIGVFSTKTEPDFQIEPDSSSGSYFCAAQWLQQSTPGRKITVANWPESLWQIDSTFPELILNAHYPKLPHRISRHHDLGDSIMTAIVLAPLSPATVVFADLGRLRVQECERVNALRTELAKCGGRVVEAADTLEVFPSELHGAEIETYHDHRMAMCFAILGLKVPGIKIKNPACVKKTFPNFFQKLAAAPPQGLGATLLHGHTGQPLNLDDLFAE